MRFSLLLLMLLQDKKQVWIAAFEDNEITTVGVLRKLSTSFIVEIKVFAKIGRLDPAGWQRLALPLGVEQALQDSIKGIGRNAPLMHLHSFDIFFFF